MNARIGPRGFPVIQTGLRCFHAFETLPLEWGLLRVTDARLDLAFSIRISDATGHGHRAVVLEHVTIKRIQSGVVNIGRENA